MGVRTLRLILIVIRLSLIKMLILIVTVIAEVLTRWLLRITFFTPVGLVITQRSVLRWFISMLILTA